MTVLNRKLYRDLYATKARLIGIVVVITIGVAIFLMYLSLYYNLERSRSRSYADCRMADFWVSIERLPLSEVDPLLEIPGIGEIRHRISQNLTVDLPEVVKPLSGTLISLPSTPIPVINNIILKRGGYFTGLRREEVIVSDGFASARDLEIGDRLNILVNDRRQELTIVGTATSSEYAFPTPPGALIPDKASYAILYVPREFAEQVMDLEGAANELVGLLSPELRQRPDPVLREIERRLEPHGVATAISLSRQASHIQVSSAINSYRVMSIIVPCVFLGAAAMILDIMMKRLATQQRTIVGTLKAIGQSNLTIIWHFLKFGVVVGLVGGVCGAASGYWLAGALVKMLGKFFEFSHLVNRPYPGILASGIALSIAFSLSGTLRGVWQVMRLNPAEAMRPKPPARTRKSLLERWGFIWRRLGFRWQMVLRGLMRQRLRVMTGVLCAMVGTTLIFMALSVRKGMDEMISFTFEKMISSDLDFSFQAEVDYGAFLETRRLPGVDHAEPVFRLFGTLSHGRYSRDGAITGILPTATLTVPRDADGNAVPVPEVGLIVTRQLAMALHLQVNDRLRVSPRRGRRQTLELPVVRIVESYTGAAAFADLHYLNRLVGEEASLNSVQAKIDPARLDELYASMKTLPKLQGFSPMREQRAQLDEIIQTQRIGLTIMIVFAGLLFGASVLTASLVSLAERRQEIATFRVLGYGVSEVSAIFLRESCLVNSAGILLGLPLGYGLARWMTHALATEDQAFPFATDASCVFLTLALGIVFTLVASFPVLRAVSRMDWRSMP